MPTATITAMTTDRRALLRLTAWMSPVFPTGGFAWSAGLERAVADGLVHDAASLRNWLSALLRQGGLRNDAILFREAWEQANDPARLRELSSLALALAASAERHAETLAQGSAFLSAARNWFGPETVLPEAETAYPVAVGAVTRLGGVGLADALEVWLQAFVSNQLQAAIRLSVTGQQGAASLLASLETDIAGAAGAAATASLDDLGALCPIADIASMNHETQRTRLFLS